MKKNVFFILLSIISTNLLSQNNYFQQQVNYNIKTELNTIDNTISSFETVTYINNSPDTLFFIYFHLWPNAYYNRNTALAKQMASDGNDDLFFKAKKVGGYIDSLDFRTNNKKLRWEYDKKHIDICKIYLDKPLFPNETIEITTPFFVKIPEDISRMGQKDSTYQITQWYPKPAVYDKNGWHQMPYLNQGEFYSEFGNFDVYITVPKQIVVAATGNLNNPIELEWLNELFTTNQQGFELENPASGDKKTLHYSEKNIHDFAWFCSEKYFVDIDSVITPNEKRKVTTWAMFTNKNKTTWQKGVEYVNNGVYYYSDWVGDYPYNNCTAVEGALSAGGGMEYPTITVISTNSIETVIVHEVGHNWFYGILGFDERRYPMLDEGINSFYDHRYSYEIKDAFPYFDLSNIATDKMPDYRGMTQLMFSIPAFFDMDQPINLHSSDYSKITYGTIIYEKMPEALYYMQEYIGRENFDNSMQSFYQKYKFTHPSPEDFENHFRNSTDKNLDWFFDGIIETDGKVDYKIKYRNNKIILKNKGHIAAPVKIVGYNKNKEAIDTIWLDPFDKKKVIPMSKDKYSKFIIDPDFNTLDFNRYNNFTRTKGIFKNYEKFKIGFNSAIMDYYSAKTNITPFVYYDNTSKFQIGALIHNIKIPVKNFTFFIMPLYSFGYNDFEGILHLQYKIHGFNGFPSTTLSFDGNRFSYYSPTSDFIPKLFKKIKFQADFKLQNPNRSDSYSKNIKISFSLIPNEIINNDFNYTPLYNVQYSMRKNSKIRPFSFKLNCDIFEQTYMLWAETKYKIHYTSLKEGLEIRIFSGSNVPLNGSYGISDFKYDHFYWSRYRNYEDTDGGILSHQFVDEYGGLTYYFNSPNFFFVNAVNIKTNIPKVPILKLYYNFASGAYHVNGKGLNKLDFQPAMYETGVLFDILHGIFGIYFPLYGSQELMDYNFSIKEKWYQHFRFTCKIKNFEEFINSL